MAPGRPETTNDRVIAVVRDNAASLLRIARRHSLCADDAQDAYQRALEIYLERLDTVDEATAGQWLRTVCKHEAMRIRAQRQRMLGHEEVAWDAQPSPEAREADERAASLERVARAAEALQGCKPDEVTAMLLKADGSSYAEIGQLTGWTYTKVNRCLAEGRARFLRRFAAIDSGEACVTWSGVLSALVDGQASADDVSRVRPHLRHCASCRAVLRTMYEAQPVLGALVPGGLLVAAAPPEVSGVLARAYEALAGGVAERIARAHAVIEVATSTKAAAVVASTAAVAAGGAAAADQVASREAGSRGASARQASVAGNRSGRPELALARRLGRPSPSAAVTAAGGAGAGTAPEVADGGVALRSGPRRAAQPAAPSGPASAATAVSDAPPELAFEAEAAGTGPRARRPATPAASGGADPGRATPAADAPARRAAAAPAEFGFEG